MPLVSHMQGCTRRCAGLVLVAIRPYPHDTLAPQSMSGYVDAVLQSRLLVLAGRLSLLSTAAFAVLSIAARMWNKEWLSKAGPFEVSRAAAQIEDEREVLKHKLGRAEDRIEDLTDTLKRTIEESDSLVRSLSAFIHDDEGVTDGGD